MVSVTRIDKRSNRSHNGERHTSAMATVHNGDAHESQCNHSKIYRKHHFYPTTKSTNYDIYLPRLLVCSSVSYRFGKAGSGIHAFVYLPFCVARSISRRRTSNCELTYFKSLSDYKCCGFHILM